MGRWSHSTCCVSLQVSGSEGSGCPDSPSDSLDGIKKGERNNVAKKEFFCQVGWPIAITGIYFVRHSDLDQTWDGCFVLFFCFFSPHHFKGQGMFD